MSELKPDAPATPGKAWAALESAGAVPAQHRTRPPKVVPKQPVSLVRALKGYLRDHPEYLEHVVMGIIHKARQGDVKCAALLFDRLDGAVIRQVQSKTEVTHVKRFGFAPPAPLEVEAEVSAPLELDTED